MVIINKLQSMKSSVIKFKLVKYKTNQQKIIIALKDLMSCCIVEMFSFVIHKVHAYRYVRMLNSICIVYRYLNCINQTIYNINYFDSKIDIYIYI